MISYMIYHLHKISAIYKKYSQIIIHHSKKKNTENKNNKNIFNKNGRCRDVKTQKVCEQGREVNIGPKIKQITSI